MAFDSIIEGMRRTNAKMVAMGQSIDIQKMPRPKPGTREYNKHATFIPSGSEIEKMLYPKNFRPQKYAEPIKEETKIIQKKETKPIIIGDEPLIDETRIKTNQPNSNTNGEKVVSEQNLGNENTVINPNNWETCRYYKKSGGQVYCKEYMCFCVKEKCFKIKK